MWSENEHPRRKPACSRLMCPSNVSASLVWLILLKTLLVIGSRMTPLQLLQSPKSPFFWQFDNESGLPRFRNCLALSYLSEYAHQKAWCFNFFSLEHFCCHSICSTCLPALHPFDGSFHLFHGRWIYTDIQVLYCRWNLSTCSGSGLFRMLSKCSFQRASFSASFKITLPSVSFTGTSLFLKPLLNILLILIGSSNLVYQQPLLASLVAFRYQTSLLGKFRLLARRNNFTYTRVNWCNGEE